MINSNGTPTFGPEGATASARCFEIDTSADFTASNNFVIGLGVADDNNIIVPAAVVCVWSNIYHAQ
jgi:hypothetical protein